MTTFSHLYNSTLGKKYIMALSGVGLFAFVVAPLRQNLQPGQNLIGTSVTEAFFVEIKVALAAGVLFSSPVPAMSNLIATLLVMPL